MANYKPAFAMRLDAFLRVKPFISNDFTRYYLNGIAVQPSSEGGVVAVATDGHRLGVRHDPEGWAARDLIVVCPKDLKDVKRGTFLAAPWLVGFCDGHDKGHISIVEPLAKREDDTPEAAIERADEALVRFGRAFIDGTFPDWKQVVVEAGKDAPKRSFNASYIKSFATKGSDLITLAGDADDSPHIVRSDDPLFVGVLMPVRDKRGVEVPAFAKAPAVKQAA